MKINFKHIEAQTSFDGSKQIFDTARDLGNLMMFNGSVLLDIGFEDLAKEIYYSKGEVEVPERYIPAIVEVMKQSDFTAKIKREVIGLLNRKGE